MKKLLYLLLFLPLFLQAQEKPKERTWIIKLNVPQLVDVATFPNLMLGVEKKITPYLSANAEFGYQFYNFGFKSDSVSFAQKGYKANLELRVYPVKLFNPNYTKKAAGLFFGFQGFYRWNQYEASAGYDPIGLQSKAKSYTDEFGVRKSALGYNFIFGYQYARYRVVFEPFIGIGYFNRKIKNYERHFNPQTQEVDYGNHHFFGSDVAEDSGDYGNLVLGFRIGFKL
jgi:hypothetical protein